jgi:hypothetical protein
VLTEKASAVGTAIRHGGDLANAQQVVGAAIGNPEILPYPAGQAIAIDGYLYLLISDFSGSSNGSCVSAAPPPPVANPLPISRGRATWSLPLEAIVALEHPRAICVVLDGYPLTSLPS